MITKRRWFGGWSYYVHSFATVLMIRGSLAPSMAKMPILQPDWIIFNWVIEQTEKGGYRLD